MTLPVWRAVHPYHRRAAHRVVRLGRRQNHGAVALACGGGKKEIMAQREHGVCTPGAPGSCPAALTGCRPFWRMCGKYLWRAATTAMRLANDAPGVRQPEEEEGVRAEARTFDTGLRHRQARTHDSPSVSSGFMVKARAMALWTSDCKGGQDVGWALCWEGALPIHTLPTVEAALADPRLQRRLTSRTEKTGETAYVCTFELRTPVRNSATWPAASEPVGDTESRPVWSVRRGTRARRRATGGGSYRQRACRRSAGGRCGRCTGAAGQWQPAAEGALVRRWSAEARRTRAAGLLKKTKKRKRRKRAGLQMARGACMHAQFIRCNAR